MIRRRHIRYIYLYICRIHNKKEYLGENTINNHTGEILFRDPLFILLLHIKDFLVMSDYISSYTLFSFSTVENRRIFVDTYTLRNKE